MKYLLLASVLTMVTPRAIAQQDPLYSQYFNNPMLINPAFAGSNERLYAGLAYRTQWTGIEGGPATFNFNSHIALMNNRVGAGLIAVQDKLGDVTNTQYGGVFSYRIKLAHSTVSFGMQTSFMRYSSNLEGIRVFNADPLFAPFSETKFNTGAGILVKGERYSVGLSVPQLLENSVSQGGQTIQIYGQNLYVFGAYDMYINEDVQFKPSVLLRATKGSSVSADLNFNFAFKQLYTAGLFTRNLNTFGVLLQAAVKNYRFGYVFELPGKKSALNFNTHEISLALSLNVLRTHNQINTGF
ncbi:type IX secretion system membrane protein PorP/SprF [soil metagenome]